MKIKRMTASFGTLDGQTLELQDGLNIIYAPNESGKSTWCAFIRSMLYGIDSSERERAGFKPDKIKYLPWSGAPMEGAMDIEYNGGEITLSRWTKSASAPMREISATYTGTSSPVPDISGTDAGEAILGVPRAVFERSAFIRQSGIAIDGSPELERRIAAIVSTGEEGASFTEVDDRLRSWLRKRRHNKHGRLPELEGQIAQNREKLKELHAAADERAQLFDELSRARAAKNFHKQALDDSLQSQREAVMSRVNAAREEVSRLERELSEAEETVESCRERLKQSRFGDADPDSIRESVLRSAEELEVAEESSEKRPSPLAWIISLALCAALFVTGFLISQPLFIGGALMLVLTVILLVRFLAASRRTQEASFSCEEVLQKYGAVSRQEILDSFAEHERLYESWTEAQAYREGAQGQLGRARSAMAELENEILDGLEQNSPQISAKRRALNEAEAAFDELSREWAMSEGRCKALGDPLVLESELMSVEESYARLSLQYEALTLAIETMQSSNEEIQNRFSPQLGKLSTAIMSFLTGGKYDELLLDRKFSATARRSGDTVAHEAAFLSEGTVGQLYLALRLAICELALPENDPCPIILDDALVDFDEERTKRALELLGELAGKRQIILFTCHKC